MSYSRFIEGDVYVILDTGGYLNCCMCNLQEREWIDDETALFKGYLKSIGDIVQTQFYTTEDMLNHLQIHIDKGDNIPTRCLEGLKQDQEENDTWIKEKNEYLGNN